MISTPTPQWLGTPIGEVATHRNFKHLEKLLSKRAHYEINKDRRMLAKYCKDKAPQKTGARQISPG